ncbi:MAG: L,D-transpeptidase family protein [Planctomycetales bacterium]|nr:L,D-transpeptidase family protein [Planctomycetales bacterium]
MRGRRAYGRRRGGRRAGIALLAAGIAGGGWALSGGGSEAVPGLLAPGPADVGAPGDAPAPAGKAPDPLAAAAEALARGELAAVREAAAAFASDPGPDGLRARLLAAKADILGGESGKAAEDLRSLAAGDPGPTGAEAARWLARLAEDRGDLAAARQALTEAWRHPGAGPERQAIARDAERVARQTILGTAHHPSVPVVVVERGDTLDGIARQNKTTVGLLRMTNGLKDDRLFPGDRLKVVKGPVELQVDRDRFRMALFIGGLLVREYPVGVGKPERPTPAVTFTVETRQVNPDWYNRHERIPFGDPRNILGTRWLGFRKEAAFQGFGIHGTSEPESVPGATSAGCIRMRNEDVEELFEVVPAGTKVVVR